MADFENEFWHCNFEFLKNLIKIPSKELCFDVNYVESALLKHNVFSLFGIDSDLSGGISKNDKISLEFRKKGNELFSKKLFPVAYDFYNKSICFATQKSENLSLGYANRSAVLYHHEKFEACLENIKLARNSNYPERFAHKLDTRERNCLQKLATTPKINDTSGCGIELSYNPNPNFSFIIDSIDTRKVPGLGLAMYTKRELSPGDVIAIDNAFCAFSAKESATISCDNCGQKDCLTLIPCPNCANAMYCNLECMNEAYKNCHEFECPIIDLLSDWFGEKTVIVRMTLTAINMFKNPKEFLEFYKKECNSSIFELENPNKKDIYKILQNSSDFDKQKLEYNGILRASMKVVFAKRFLFTRTNIKERILYDDELQKSFGDILLHNWLFTKISQKRINFKTTVPSLFSMGFYTGIYPLYGILYPSCNSNVGHILKGKNMILFATQTIPVNGYLTSNFTVNITDSKIERQRVWQRNYLWDCKCDFCEHDKEIPIKHNLPLLRSYSHKYLTTLNREALQELFKYYCKFLKQIEKFHPCFETIECIRMLTEVFQVIAMK